ncbi:hypothetical protein ABK040_012717 [Willaertia magna]
MDSDDIKIENINSLQNLTLHYIKTVNISVKDFIDNLYINSSEMHYNNIYIKCDKIFYCTLFDFSMAYDSYKYLFKNVNQVMNIELIPDNPGHLFEPMKEMILNCNGIQSIIHFDGYYEGDLTISYYYKIDGNKFVNMSQQNVDNNAMDYINVVKNGNEYIINEIDPFEIYNLQFDRYNVGNKMVFNLLNLTSLQDLRFCNNNNRVHDEIVINNFSNLATLIIYNICNLQIPFSNLKNLTELEINNSSNIKLFNTDSSLSNEELSSIIIENVSQLQIDLTLNCPKLMNLLLKYSEEDKQNINLTFKYVPLLENVNISTNKEQKEFKKLFNCIRARRGRGRRGRRSGY